MQTYTVYSEAGGVGKTTLSVNLAKAEERAGRDVLVIDLDPQEGSLSHMLDVADDRTNSDADSLVRHLVERPRGEFHDLIKTSEGIDVVPAHNSLENLGKHLTRREEEAADFGENWNANVQLLRVLKEADVPSQYDTLIVDPPATADVKLYNAIHATRNLVIPLEPSGKGNKSVHGLDDLVSGLEDRLSITVGVLAVVPNGYRDMNSQDRAIERIGEMDEPYDMPVTLRERRSLFEGCWEEQCSAFTYVDEYRDREREHEMETLAKIEQLAAYIRPTTEVKA